VARREPDPFIDRVLGIEHQHPEDRELDMLAAAAQRMLDESEVEDATIASYVGEERRFSVVAENATIVEGEDLPRSWMQQQNQAIPRWAVVSGEFEAR